MRYRVSFYCTDCPPEVYCAPEPDPDECVFDTKDEAEEYAERIIDGCGPWRCSITEVKE